jgi:hypothetical protein
LAENCPLQDTGSRVKLPKLGFVTAVYPHDLAKRGTIYWREFSTD